MKIPILIKPDGTIMMIYNEIMPSRLCETVKIQRASHVEPTPDNQWTADLTPVGGPVLGPFDLRSQALQAENDWIVQNIGTIKI